MKSLSPKWFICILIAVLIVCLAIFGCFALSEYMTFGVTAPAFTATPTPVSTSAPAVSAIVAVPTPTPTPAQAERIEGVHVIIKNKVIFAADSAKTAYLVITDYMNAMAETGIASNEWLVSCSLPDKVYLAPADGSVLIRDHDSAYAYLMEDAQRLPLVRIVARCTTQSVEPQEETRVSDALPACSRIVSFGANELTAIYTETEYLGQLESSVIETNRFRLRDSIPKLTVTGGYTAKNPNGEPGRNEGETGPKSGALDFDPPIHAAVYSNYGMRKGQMHYGIDYRGKTGTMVFAPEEGVVVYCANRGAYGFVIDIRHGDSGFVTRISGMGEVNVELWERVSKGQQLGTLGGEDNYGILHFEIIIDGIPYNPLQYL